MTIRAKDGRLVLQENRFMVKATISILVLVMLHLAAPAEELFVNFKTGNDANPGTKSQPLRTIREAASRVNNSAATGTTTILLSEGVHLLTETVLFNNNKFTSENRLVIRAEMMPDDSNWTPQRMPIIATVVPTLAQRDGEEARGLEIEASHVTIEGLRFTGSLDYYYIDGRQNRRSYPIWRDGKNLDDLLITQCLFAGNIDVLPLRLAIIANGHGLVAAPNVDLASEIAELTIAKYSFIASAKVIQAYAEMTDWLLETT